MKNTFALLAALSTFSVSAYADGINLQDCPASVQQTIQANSQGGKLDEIEMIKIGDRTRYVADFDLSNDKDLKVHVDQEGKLLKTSEDLASSELPAPISAAVEKLVPAGGKLSDADKQIAEGKTTYHIEIDRPNAPDLEAVLSDTGAVLSQQDEAND